MSFILSLSAPSSASQTHPLPLRLGRYCCGIWVVVFVAVVVADTVPHNGSNARYMRSLCVLKNVAGNPLACQRRDKDGIVFVVVTIFCGTVVGAKHVGYFTASRDTDQG